MCPPNSTSSRAQESRYQQQDHNDDGCDSSSDIESAGEGTAMLSDDDRSINIYQSVPKVVHDYNNSTAFLNDSFSSVASFSDSYINVFESNRGIILAVFNLLIYMILAVFAYSYWFEHWSIIDSLYFAVCTFTTIGYGDMFPSSDASRLFTAGFAVYGIIILGFFVGLVGEKIVEMHNQALEAMRNRKETRATNMFDVDDEDDNQPKKGKKGKKAAPAPLVPHKNRTVSQLIVNVILLEAPLLAGTLAVALAIGHFQGWSISSSIYYGVITSTTVGFGDLSIQGETARAISIVALPLMVAIFCEVLSRIAGAYLQYKVEQEEKMFLNRQLTVQDLLNMDEDSNGEVDWAEFMTFMLQAMGKVQAEDIVKLREIFDKLDTSKDGVLSKDDLITAATS